MKVLVLWAHEESPNLGVAALARGSEVLLRQTWPDADVTLVNFGRRPEGFFIGSPRAMLRERVTGRHGMMRWLRQFDVVWDTRSGDSMTDIYGEGRHRLMSTVYGMATAAGATGVIAPQTIGPFTSSASTRRARRSLRRSALVFSRDPVSEVAAAELGRPVDDSVTDVVFAIPAPDTTVEHDVLLNVSGLLWNENPHVDHELYRATILETIDRVEADGRRVSLLAHVLDSPVADNDVPVVRSLASDGREVVVPESLDDVRAHIAGSQVVVAARMHACMNAISLGVPALPMAYSRKFAPLFESISWHHGVDLREEGAHSDRLVAEVRRSAELRVDAAAAARRAQESLGRVVSRLRALEIS